MEVRFKHATCQIDFLETEDEGKYVYLSEMYVPPEHRKKGFATGLLRKIIDLAKCNDCKSIVIHCLYDNVPALLLYLNNSFEIKGVYMQLQV